MWGAPTACTCTFGAGSLPHDGARSGRVVEVDVRQEDRADIAQGAPHLRQAGAQGVQAGLGTRIDQRDAVREVQHPDPDDGGAALVVQVDQGCAAADAVRGRHRPPPSSVVTGLACVPHFSNHLRR